MANVDLTKVLSSLKEVKKAASPTITSDRISAEVKTPTVANSEATKGKFVSGAMKVVNAALPIAAAIPGPIGAVASVLKTALNDDEWFEEYGIAGATFNELLTLSEDFVNLEGYDEGTERTIRARASYASVLTGCTLTDAIKKEIMPSVLAYVRSKTNNVLNETVDAYSECLDNIIKLYAVYYTLRKYEKLALNIPLNIPSLPDVCNALNPATYNQLVGIGDALEAYLRTTTGLPYALAAYIRWRFGTTFFSENTGKPGMICYDYTQTSFNTRGDISLVSFANIIKWAYYGKQGTMTDADAIDIIGTLMKHIEELKTNIHATGRCAADFALAYKDNGILYSVDDAHYDAKEFNLRCNFTMGTYGDGKLVLDSRLVASPALQAVTISTQISDALVTDINKMMLFPVLDTVMYTYDPNNAFQFTYGTGTSAIPFRWKSWYFTDVSNQVISRVFPQFSISNWTDSPVGPTATFSAGGVQLFQYMLRFMSLTSLQFHNKGIYIPIYNEDKERTTYFEFTALSYDTAYISDSQLESIQRIALRNLFRGNYSRRVEVSHQNTKIREETETFVEEVLPDKINIKN